MKCFITRAYVNQMGGSKHDRFHHYASTAGRQQQSTEDRVRQTMAARQAQLEAMASVSAQVRKITYYR